MVRKKHRYFVVRIQYANNSIDTSLKPFDVFRAIEAMAKELYGDYGIAVYLFNVNVKYINPYTGIIFVQCNRDYHKEIRNCITFIKFVKQKQCILTTVHVTATIRSAERFLLRYNTDKMNLLYQKCKTPHEKQDLWDYMKMLGIENTLR